MSNFHNFSEAFFSLKMPSYATLVCFLTKSHDATLQVATFDDLQVCKNIDDFFNNNVHVFYVDTFLAFSGGKYVRTELADIGRRIFVRKKTSYKSHPYFWFLVGF